MPPLGIAVLAAVLRENRFDVEIIDFRDTGRWNRREELIRDAAPDAVGVSSMTPNFPAAATVARFCKESLGVPVIYGGPHPTGAPETVLRFGNADAVLPGYADGSFLSLCETLRAGGRIEDAPGAMTLDDRGVLRANPSIPNFNIDEIPPPARDLLPMSEYTTYIDSPVYGRIDANTLAASRGCAYHCSFCISNSFERWQGRRPDLVCDEIQSLLDNYPQPGLLFYDLLFTVSPEWVRAVCEEMTRRGLNKLKWYAMGRLSVVDTPTLSAMRRAGCVLLSYGVESLDNAALSAINKDQTFEQVERGIRLTYEAGITPMAHFIVGLPGQTESDLFSQLDTIERWIRNYHFYPGDFYPTMVFPGTRLHESLPQWRNHNWLDTVSPGFVFPNVPIHTNLIPPERALELSDILNVRCRKLLSETSNIYNKQVRSRGTRGASLGNGDDA